MEQQFEEISFKRLTEILMQSISMIVAVTIIAGIIAFVYSETMVVPEYESTVSLYVNNESGKNTDKILGTDITASQMLVDTYIIIIKSNTVLNEVCEKLEEQGIEGYDAESLAKKIDASATNETEIFGVTVRDTNPKHTYMIANIIADVAPPIIKDFVEASSVKVIDYAKEGKRVSPNIQRNTILGLLIGLILSCGFVVLREMFDMRIKTEDDLTKMFELPILGIIPDINDPQNRKSGYYYYKRGSRNYEYRKEERAYVRSAENEYVSKNKTNSK